jgi:hypothetical protein
MPNSRLLFGCAIFLASFLLFLVEPIAAKQLLPVFGGSAAVWITCLVFFQTALLCAYLYAHWQTQSTGRSSSLLPWTLHLLLLTLATAAAVVFAFQKVDQNQALEYPILSIFAALALSIGLPFLMLGATSPLLQVWLARVETGEIPYRLFALSNLASLLALGLYPTLIEPYFTLKTQRLAWCCGFVAFALISAFLTRKTCAWKTGSANRVSPLVAEEPEAALPKAPLKHKLLWLLLPMGAAMQLSAVTSYITANIAPIPLLWIVPLAVYLITLILAFQFPRLVPRWLMTRLLVVLLASLGYMMMKVDVSLPMRIGIGFFLIELLLSCLFLHSEASALRPQRASESTLFYLLFAAGGALGSFLIGIASPLIFRYNYDLALTFFITAALALAVLWSSGWGQRLLWGTATLLLLVLVFFIQIAYDRNTPVAVRNFYGSLRLKQGLAYPGAVMRTLSNGNIQHGTQIFSPDLERNPTTYYARDSGIGLTLDACCKDGGVAHPRNIGVIGLGAGTLAAYGQKGDRIRFYEINPAVVPIAQNLFTYMRDSAAQINIIDGDARTSLAREQPQNFDVLVVDAFSGDAIPLHLLTTEAVALYKRHLAPGGILAFHISNQHVDLEPEIVQLARAAGMQAMRVSSPINEERGEFSATWMLVTDSPTFFNAPEIFNRAKKPLKNPNVRLWTDDYSSLLPILRW